MGEQRKGKGWGAGTRRDLGARVEDGVTFRVAWPDAVRVALTETKAGDKGEWRVALAATEQAWHAAYTNSAGPGNGIRRELFSPD